ncbi:hypothetical protein I302_103080 [Kwoniella bestiolae CBS 10118]|uniref:(S)-ureidoglycine aminohydrolase cupin domain-containing protein n=1 Tax=Kwoniella bestiolae CBS 10118 TaxID=1296100 RepID=A0A1B9GGT3_9TREE|nr:hypothetical protein I302_01779 [Kwoniella bestiolae CBS 10118]OCF30260.1 hypothetical protein I302_01779 [Kwoniella bestiolae CBS 10118]
MSCTDLYTVAPVPLTIIKGASHAHLPLPQGENGTVGDILELQTNTKDEKCYITSGFYRIVAGPARPATYDFEEAKLVLRGEIDILDEATGVAHHTVPGDYIYFHVGSKVQFSSQSEGFAFYVVTRPTRNPHMVDRAEQLSPNRARL